MRCRLISKMEADLRHAIINATTEQVSYVNVEDLRDAEVLAGLDPMGVDHGTIEHGLGIVLYEFGLLEPMEHYFILNRQLYAGNAVVYAYNGQGETIDVPPHRIAKLNIQFFHSIAAVEEALDAGKGNRPYTAINSEVLAVWRNGVLGNV